MQYDALFATARNLMADEKGLLAMDESTPTANKRFAARGIPTTEAARLAYRRLIVTAPGLAESISGAILYDETIRQTLPDGTPMAQALADRGIVPGIKVDAGTVALPGHAGESLTEGLDGLGDRLGEYYAMGARFAKWRAVITIGPGLPTRAAVEANMQQLALYAACCQEAGLVPIVEPEVLMDGHHSLERCREVTTEVLHTLFDRLYRLDVFLPGTLLKPNMVLPGTDNRDAVSVEAAAEATVTTLLRTAPAALGGIAFLSGGQSPDAATAHLNAMHRDFGDRLPWPLTFSFSRAVQQPALDAWGGDDANTAEAQRLLVAYTARNRQARRGAYNP